MSRRLRAKCRRSTALQVRIGLFVAAAAAAVGLALGVPSASAYHIAGATYTGTHSAGGTVELDVSADGTLITRFRITNVPGNTCTVNSSQYTYSPSATPIPITNNTFSFNNTTPTGLSPEVIFTGTFNRLQTVQGTYVLTYRLFGCTAGPVNWTATTTSPGDVTPPDTAIAGGPSGRTNQKTASFSFTSTESASTFQCRLDSAAFALCTSPYTTGALPDGTHTFEVQAVDESGNADPTPAQRSFTVDTAAPQTTITGGPPGKSKNRTPRFGFRSSEANSTFQCRLDSRPWSGCTSPKRYGALPLGPHVFQARATDAVGNQDPSPARRLFRIVAG